VAHVILNGLPEFLMQNNKIIEMTAFYMFSGRSYMCFVVTSYVVYLVVWLILIPHIRCVAGYRARYCDDWFNPRLICWWVSSIFCGFVFMAFGGYTCQQFGELCSHGFLLECTSPRFLPATANGGHIHGFMYRRCLFPRWVADQVWSSPIDPGLRLLLSVSYGIPYPTVVLYIDSELSCFEAPGSRISHHRDWWRGWNLTARGFVFRGGGQLGYFIGQESLSCPPRHSSPLAGAFSADVS
jgi:hypothetical protein